MNKKSLYTLKIDLPTSLADAVASRLFDLGLRGLEEQDHDERTLLVTYGEDASQIDHYAKAAQDYLAALIEIDPAAREAEVVIKKESGSNWATAWMKYFQPTQVTERITVRPPWIADPLPPDAVVLIIEPKMAFGYGTHASTRLAACAVERFCRAHPQCRVLDVGTGTGILAMVAAKNGAANACGLDHDPLAVTAACENAALNKLDHLCRFAETPLAECEGAYDLIVANINALTLVEMAGDLQARLAEGGTLALAGILTDSADKVFAAFKPLGFHESGRDTEEEWCLLKLERS